MKQGKTICRTTSYGITNMGQIPLFQSIQVQNPTMSPFSNVDLVWKNGFRHGGHNKVAIEITYIPPTRISKKLECEQGDMQTPIEWNKNKNLAL
jgi:hypothetical protein